MKNRMFHSLKFGHLLPLFVLETGKKQLRFECEWSKNIVHFNCKVFNARQDLWVHWWSNPLPKVLICPCLVFGSVQNRICSFCKWSIFAIGKLQWKQFNACHQKLNCNVVTTFQKMIRESKTKQNEHFAMKKQLCISNAIVKPIFACKWWKVFKSLHSLCSLQICCKISSTEFTDQAYQLGWWGKCHWQKSKLPNAKKQFASRKWRSQMHSEEWQWNANQHNNIPPKSMNNNWLWAKCKLVTRAPWFAILSIAVANRLECTESKQFE